MQETRVLSLGWEDPLEKGMAIPSSILAWDSPWSEPKAGYSPQLHRVRDNLATKLLPPPPLQFLGQPQNSYWKIHLKNNNVRNCEQTQILSYVHSYVFLYTWIDTKHLNQSSAFFFKLFILYWTIGDSVVKNPPAMQEIACNVGDVCSIPGFPGEGTSNPLQYSCLENSMNRGAWQATVHGATRVRHDLATKPPPP